MTVTLYKSTDGSAPVLTGQAGSLITVLDAVLVHGYGAKPAAGWTKAFSGTNGADYRQGSGSSQFYLDVNDNGPSAGTGKEARIKGYESMSAYQTGSNLFPTAVQMASGLFVRKSNTADATARAWSIAADERTFYMFVLTGDAANIYLAWGFGEFYSYKAGDGYRCMIIARDTENSATTNNTVERMDIQNAVITSTIGGHYLARDDLANVGAIAFGKQGDIGVTPGNTLQNFSGTINWYNRPDGNLLYLFPVRLHYGNPALVRGRLRGFWHFGHAITNVNDGDTFTGASGGDLNGRSFLVIKGGGNGGVYIVETSDTWEAN